MAAPHLEVFKARLNVALSNLVYWKMDWIILKVPSNQIILWFNDLGKKKKIQRWIHTFLERNPGCSWGDCRFLELG